MSADSIPVLVELAVGEAQSQAALADADAIVALAANVGVAAIRLVDRVGEHRAIDPSVVGAHLAGRYPDIGWVIDAPTTQNAPYNLARRVLSFDRATGGRAGLVLIAGGGDEVSAAATPDRDASDPADRWVEYANILIRLWESFPRAALLGDQESALVADDGLIRPIDFDGRFYRVAGPLDGPSSVQGRPVLIAADPTTVGWSRVAAVADAVIVDAGEIDRAAAKLGAALATAGRRRDEVALLARVDNARAVPDLGGRGVAGVVLAVDGGAPEILGAVRALGQQASPARRGTLRADLVRPHPGRVLA